MSNKNWVSVGPALLQDETELRKKVCLNVLILHYFHHYYL